MDQILDTGIVGDRKVQILSDTAVTFQSIDDKVSQNVVFVDQCEDILKICRADDDINTQIFLPTRYNGVFDMLVHE